MNKAIRLALFCCLASASLLAQLPTDSPVDVLRHPGWNKGLFVGGGTSVASSPSGQSLLVGFRLGRVLTNEHGGGFLLWTTANIPPGDTSQINFTSGAEVGVQMFGKERNSWDLAVKAYHLSNASIGNHNPGINASLQFMLGYTWH